MQPRITDEIKKFLQLLEKSRIGDWYLYQNHTEIKVYGTTLIPYKFPKYLPMRLSALEYIRQILNSYSVNLLAAKKKTQFKLKNQVGPFICNKREAGAEAEKQLLDYKFSKNFLWLYDPYGIISKMRVKCKLTPYIHEKKFEIEKFSNQFEWLENTLVEADKQSDTSHILQTRT